MNTRSDRIRKNIATIRARIAAAASRVNRPETSVSLLAVTKNVALPDMRAAIEAGITGIGENRVQEAVKKFAQIGPHVSWHMLGHLQTNKARPAAMIFDMVQSIDSARTADALDQAAASLDRELNVLVEVNVGGEEQKNGVSPEQARELVAYVAAKRCLRPRGLMAMAPVAQDPEWVRPFFRHLAGLFEELHREVVPSDRWDTLSMGMTHDFEVAVEEGATLVRIGTGIFSIPPGEMP